MKELFGSGYSSARCLTIFTHRRLGQTIGLLSKLALRPAGSSEAPKIFESSHSMTVFLRKQALLTEFRTSAHRTRALVASSLGKSMWGTGFKVAQGEWTKVAASLLFRATYARWSGGSIAFVFGVKKKVGASGGENDLTATRGWAPSVAQRDVFDSWRFPI
jgi:hypothetical protein